MDLEDYIRAVRTELASNEQIEFIYNASKDSLNPNRVSAPFESTTLHNTAGEVIKDALYIARMKQINEVARQSYNKEMTKKLTNVSCNQEMESLKPTFDEVLDTQNAIQLLTRGTVGELSSSEIDTLLDSELFNTSTVLKNKEDRDGLKQFIKPLADTTKMLKEKDLLGSVQEHEMRESIKEFHYLNFTKYLTKQMWDNKDDSKTIRVKKFIGRNLFQNNQALHDLGECMKTALNPTTNVETIPSLSKNCIEKYKGQLQKQIDEFDNDNNNMKGWLGLFVVGVIVQAMPLIAKAKQDKLHALIDEMNKKIIDDTRHITSADNKWAKQARMMSLLSDKNDDIENHQLKASHATTLSDEIEKESIAKLLRNKKELVDTFHIKNEEFVSIENLIKNENRDNDNSNNDYKKELLDSKNRLVQLQEKYFKLKQTTINNGIPNLQELNENISNLEKQEQQIYQTLFELEKDKSLTSSEKINKNKKLLDDVIIIKNELEKTKDNLSLSRELEKTTNEIEKYNQKVTELENILSSSRKKESNLLGFFKRNARDEVVLNINSLKKDDILKTISLFGEIKNSIDKKIFELEKDKTTSPQELENLFKQRDRYTRVIETLMIKSYKDNYLLSQAIKENLKDSYGIDIEIDEIFTDGNITSENIANILNKATHLTTDTKRALRSNLFASSITIEALKNQKDLSSLEINSFSSLVSNTQKSKLFQKISKYNDTYVAFEEIEGGDNAFLQVSHRHLGYLIKKAQTEAIEVEMIRDNKTKEYARKNLLDTISVLEKRYSSKGGSFERYKDIATSSLKEGVTLEESNKDLHTMKQVDRRNY